MDNGEKITIDDFVDIFSKIYGHYDRKRNIEQLWLQVVEESANISEAVREIDYSNLTRHIANVFCWLCSFINRIRKTRKKAFRIDRDFSSIIWYKYPNICPLCQVRPCRCLLKREEIQARSSATKNKIYDEIRKESEKSMHNRYKRLNLLCDMFESIFKPNYYVMSLEEITFHYMEEVGEVSEHLRKLASTSLRDKTNDEQLTNLKKDFTKEIADVFSWLCAIVIKLNALIRNNKKILTDFNYLNLQTIRIPFVEVIKKYYYEDSKFRCPTCKQTKCDLSKHGPYYPIK